jgi:hypothetical protein
VEIVSVVDTSIPKVATSAPTSIIVCMYVHGCESDA